mgnify:CR=1 FL=1
MGQIDINFNVFSDTPEGKDPDSHSPTLRKYHKTLWSKPLPNGRRFDLTLECIRRYYLQETSPICNLALFCYTNTQDW